MVITTSGQNMIDEAASWVFKQGSIVVSYALGVLSSYVMIKKANTDRFDSLEKSVKFLKDLLDKTREDVDEADAKCERRVAAVLKENERLIDRIQKLEDSRAFILQNALKKHD